MPLPFQRRGGAQLRPTFSRDFAGLKTLDHGTGPAINFTRASNATFFDANGVLQTASNDQPRFDHDPATGASRGLLIEEARTNSIRNSQAGGSTNGVIGSGGVMPTNWSAGLTSGINREVVGTGTQDGMPYVDVRYYGTNSSGSVVFPSILFESETQVVASAAQTWTGSFYAAIVGGSTTGINSIRANIFESTSAGVYLANNNTTHSLTSSLARYSHTRTLTEATTARVSLSIVIFIAGSATIDLTLRIAAPQLEQGAFPTSYIPTTTAAATRSADFAKIDGISSFFNAAEGSVYTEHTQLVAKTSGSVNKFSWVMNFGANAEYPVIGVYAQNQSTDTLLGQAVKIDTIGHVVQAEQGFSVALTAGTIHKFIAGYATNNVATYRNGSAGGTDDTVDLSGITGMDRMGIGNLYRDTVADEYINGHIRKIAYWPKRLSNTLLQQLTT